MPINRQKVFTLARGGLFTLYSNSQVSGINFLLDGWEESGLTDLRWLSYIFATVYHETAKTFQPIKEYGGLKYLMSKPYWPYYGRGYVQLTWKANYETMEHLWNSTHEDQILLVKNPDLAQEPRVARFVLFEGMTKGLSSKGDFTGKSLENYFNSTTTDFVGARHIINGSDKADLIAGYAKDFYKIFRIASGEK